jgi:peptide/nickel transport system substrate-binding protein
MGLMHSRWPLFGALVAGVTAMAAIGYIMLSSNPAGEAVPASGGSYTEGVTRVPDRINPLFAAANQTDRDLAALIFNGLVRLGPDGMPAPDLAERWEVVGNGASYIFHLRQGVAWHDDPDQAFTADDVVFTFDAISDPGFRGDPELAQLMDGVSVTARDSATVEFRLEQAYAPFLAYLTVGILPEHLLRDLDADGLFNAEFNSNPVGTGPYRLRALTADGAILESNPTYHFGPPHISTIRFRAYADDGSLVEGLRRGDIDGALLSPAANGSDLTFLEDNAEVHLNALTDTSFRIAYFDTRLALFASTAVRNALALGTDAQALVDGVTGGSGTIATAGIPPGSWAYGETEPLEFDPGTAARALEIAGWSRGSDGVRANAGLRLAFTLSTPNDATSVALAEQLVRQWRAIGAEVEVLPREGGSYVEDVLLARDFEAAIAEVDYGADPDPYPFWHSSQVQPPGRNVAGYQDSAMDDDLERARQTTDAERRQELYASFTDLFIEGAPSVNLYHPTWTYTQASALRGFERTLLFEPSARFHNVHEWYLHTRTVD